MHGARRAIASARPREPAYHLLRFDNGPGRSESDGTREVSVETGKGDLLVLASQGLFSLRTSGKPASADQSVMRLARAAETQPLSAAFAALVAEWKKTGLSPGSRDVLLLAAKKT
jgi:hypothetical protein